MKELIRKHGWKSVKIKWKESGGNGGQNGWDFALMKANGNSNNDAAKNYCEKKDFKTPVNADWTAVYKNLGWNVNSKDNKNEKICI